jgi:hypothetical protein
MRRSANFGRGGVWSYGLRDAIQELGRQYRPRLILAPLNPPGIREEVPPALAASQVRNSSIDPTSDERPSVCKLTFDCGVARRASSDIATLRQSLNIHIGICLRVPCKGRWVTRSHHDETYNFGDTAPYPDSQRFVRNRKALVRSQTICDDAPDVLRGRVQTQSSYSL